MYESRVRLWVNVLMVTLFAAPNVALWNSSVFATPLEQRFWRICSGIMVAIPIILGPAFRTYSLMLSRRENLDPYEVEPAEDSTTSTFSTLRRVTLRLSVHFLVYLYFVVRLCLLVETFYSLHSSPRSVYEDVVWTNYIPHFS